LIFSLSNGYPKTKDECIEFLGIKDTAFYNYCKTLREVGFDLIVKDGRYSVDCAIPDSRILLNVLHFTEEELFLLSKSIDMVGDGTVVSSGLKRKLVSFLNHDKVIDDYLMRYKSSKVGQLREAIKLKRQVLLVNYSSGNSETVKDRLVEPFEFKDDFNLIWAFDVDLKQNRQFKVSRIEEVVMTTINWEYGRSHHSMPVDIFRNTGDLNCGVEILLNIKARNLLIEEYPLSEREITKVSENRFELKTKVAKYEGPARFVLGLTDSVEVLGDEMFFDFLQKKRKRST